MTSHSLSFKTGCCQFHTIQSTLPPIVVLWSSKYYVLKATFTFTKQQSRRVWLWLSEWNFQTKWRNNKCAGFGCQTIPPTQGLISTWGNLCPSTGFVLSSVFVVKLRHDRSGRWADVWIMASSLSHLQKGPTSMQLPYCSAFSLKAISGAVIELICLGSQLCQRATNSWGKPSVVSTVGSCSHISLQPLQAVHPLHVPLNGGRACYWFGALGKEPSSFSIAQSLPFTPA